jgi:hypothetical protein
VLGGVAMVARKAIQGVSYLPGQQDMIADRSIATPQARKPRVEQRPCDIGLFSDDASQLDLVEMSRKEWIR